MVQLQRWKIVSCERGFCDDGLLSMRLIEETESHVIILLLFLGFLLLGLGGRSCSSGWSGGSRCGPGGGHGSNLLLALGDQLFNVLSGQLLDNQVEFLGIGINSNGAEDLFDVGGRGFTSSKGSKKSSGNVTHF